MIDGDLTGDDGRAAGVSIFDDLEEIAALIIADLLRSPIVEDEQIRLCQRLKQAAVATVPLERPSVAKRRGTRCVDGEILAAGLVAECAGEPTLANAGRPDQQKL